MIILIKNNYKKNRIFLWVLFFLSLIVRLFLNDTFLLDNPCQLMYDSGQYHAVATSLAHGDGFTNSDGSPHFYRLPGYPIFLSAVYAVAGDNPDAAMIVQIIVSSFIPLLIYLLFLTFFPGNIIGARIAGLLASVHVGFLIFSGLVMTETFFLLFFLLFCLLFFSGTYYGLAGIFLGCASLFRPVGTYFIILTFVLMMLQSQRIRDILVCGLGWLIVVIPWLVRNMILTGTFFFHTLQGPHFLNHGATRVVMAYHKISYESAKKLVNHEHQALLNAQKKPLNELERSKIAEKLAFKIMLMHPYESIKLCIVNMLKTMFSLYSSELLMIDSRGTLPPYENNRSLSGIVKKFLMPIVNNRWIIFVIYYEIIFFLLMLLATLCYVESILFDRKKIIKIIPIILFSALFIGLSCVCGFARLRIALEPFLLIVTAYYASQIFRYLLKRVFIKVEPTK